MLIADTYFHQDFCMTFNLNCLNGYVDMKSLCFTNVYSKIGAIFSDWCCLVY